MGEKIKIRDIEGDSDALASFFKSSDCSLAEYLNIKKKPKIKLYGLGISILVFVVISCVLWSLPAEVMIWRKTLTIINFVSYAGAVICLHLYVRNVWLTMIGVVIGLCVLGMSTNVMTTQDAVKKVEHTIERLDYN